MPVSSRPGSTAVSLVPVAIAGLWRLCRSAHCYPVVRLTTRLAFDAVGRTVVSPWPTATTTKLAGLAGHVTLVRLSVSNVVDCGLLLKVCISANVALYVRAISMALSNFSVSPRRSSYSCIFACFIPTISCSMRCSTVSRTSRNWHFFACSLQRVMNSSTDSDVSCRLNLFSLLLDFSWRISVYRSHSVPTVRLRQLPRIKNT